MMEKVKGVNSPGDDDGAVENKKIVKQCIYRQIEALRFIISNKIVKIFFDGSETYDFFNGVVFRESVVLMYLQ